ncbi:MAG: malate dehydrogenase, partial [Acidimicrobiia bacterium]
IVGGSDYGPTEGSDLVVITAGVPRKPGQSRSDLAGTNSEIVAAVATQIAQRCPSAIIIVVSNPLDEMTTLTYQVTGFPPERVVGMAGELDTARYRYFVAAELGVHPDQVDGIVLGSHGETMVPLPRLTRVKGRPLSELLSPDRVEALVERTRGGGAEIVGLLPGGSAWMAPSAAIAGMVKAVAKDEARVVSACALLRGEYGLSDVFVGVPVRLGRRGVIEIVELPLNDEELALLRAAAETVRARTSDLAGGDSPASQGEEPTILEALREESRVRRAATQILWEQGSASPEEIELLTRKVLDQMKGR